MMVVPRQVVLHLLGGAFFFGAFLGALSLVTCFAFGMR